MADLRKTGPGAARGGLLLLLPIVALAACNVGLGEITCQLDGDCPSGYRCDPSQGLCVLRAEATNLGVSPDGSPTEIGARDRAQPTDALRPESGSSDAGELDTAQMLVPDADASRADTALGDAAARDASPPDLGRADLGAGDAATTDVLAPDLAAGDCQCSDPGQPDCAGTDAVQPDAAAPDSSHADLVPVDHAAPDLFASDLAAPDLYAPDLATPDLAAPDTVVADSALPDSAIPDTAQPDQAQADAGCALVCTPPEVCTLEEGGPVCTCGGMACGPGEECLEPEPNWSGVTGPLACCPADTWNCSGHCVDLTSDPSNCGVCGGMCGGSTGGYQYPGVCGDSQLRLEPGQCACSDIIVQPKIPDPPVIPIEIGCPLNGGGGGYLCSGRGCMCSAYDNLPCPVGTFCCQNQGCCVIPCSQAPGAALCCNSRQECNQLLGN